MLEAKLMVVLSELANCILQLLSKLLNIYLFFLLLIRKGAPYARISASGSPLHT